MFSRSAFVRILSFVLPIAIAPSVVWAQSVTAGARPVTTTTAAVGASYSSATIRSSTVIDEIIVDFKKSKAFADFMNKMATKVLPGDDIFLAKKIYSAPDILKVKKMPVLTYELGIFYLRSAKSETSIQPFESEHIEFDVNRNKIAFPVYANPSTRWATLSDALLQSQKAWISFMPVAFAAENSGIPTLTSLMAFAIISRIARSTSKLNTNVVVDKGSYSYLDVWKKSVEFKAGCSSDYMLQLARKMAEIDVSTLSCQPEGTAFDMPAVPEGNRHFLVKKTRDLEVSGTGFSKPIQYQRDYAGDIDLGYVLDSEDEGGGTPADAPAQPVKAKKKVHRHFSLRAKGMKWKPVGNVSDDAVETGEHVREFTNTVLNGDLCRKCANFFKHAAHVIHEETDPEELKTVASDTAKTSGASAAAPTTAPSAPAAPTAPAADAPTMNVPTVTE